MSRVKSVNKVKIARSFKRGGKTYDSHARVQQLVSSKLVEMLKSHSQVQSKSVFEIGCCTGNLTELFLKNFTVETLYLNDLVPDFYNSVSERIKGFVDLTIQPHFGDIESLQLPSGLDLVISSATFQWLADLQTLFNNISDSLNNGGILAFSIFGPGTLSEFRDVTGIGLKYSAVGMILDMLEEKYHIEQEQTVKNQLFFSTPREVLKHLQATGVGGVQEYRWTRSTLRDFEQQYYEKFGGTSGVPVTYVSSYVIASKK